jgi:thymidylate kinase
VICERWIYPTPRRLTRSFGAAIYTFSVVANPVIPAACRSLRDQLAATAPARGTPALLAVTGASGAGKTSVIQRLRTLIDPRLLPTLAFDSLGVPPESEMSVGWDDRRAWQKAMTWHWVYTARHVYRTRPLVILEGSFDPQYAISACHANRVPLRVVVLDIAPSTCRDRLARRGQPELATDDMARWAGYLRETAQQLGGQVVDARPDLDTVCDRICAIARELLGN